MAVVHLSSSNSCIVEIFFAVAPCPLPWALLPHYDLLFLPPATVSEQAFVGCYRIRPLTLAKVVIPLPLTPYSSFFDSVMPQAVGQSGDACLFAR
jgi:hypothetical protein